MALELIIPDTHDQVLIYKKSEKVLEALAKKGKIVQSVFHVGDFSDRINRRRLAELAKGKPDLEAAVQTLFNSVVPLRDAIESFLRVQPDIFDKVLIPEAKERYAPANDFADMVRRKYNADMFGTLGNHDQGYAMDVMPNIDYLPRSQSLMHEGVIGMHGNFKSTLNAVYSGAHYELAVHLDDDDDLQKSIVYRQHTNKSLKMVLTHAHHNFNSHNGFNMNIILDHCAGLSALADENRGLIIYAGHMHGSLIYRDPVNDALLLRPGVGYVFVVDREGNRVKSLEAFKLRNVA